MAEPLVTKGERVGREIARRIRTIVLPNGDHISPAAVSRTDRNPLAEAAPVFITIREASDRYAVTNLGRCGKIQVAAEIPIVVAITRSVDEEKPLAIRDLWLRVYDALLRDDGMVTGTMGGLVTTIEPVDMIPDVVGPESSRVSALFTFRARYSFPADDPTEVPAEFVEVDP